MTPRKIFYFVAPWLISCGGEAPEEKPDDNNSDSTAQVTEIVEVEHTAQIAPKNVSIFWLGTPIPAQLPADLKMRKAVHHHKSGGTTAEIDMQVIYGPIEDMVDLQLESNAAKEENELNIIEMVVHSDYYKTVEGIGVNSSIEELINTYPDCLFWHTSNGERFVAASPAIEGIQFIFNFDACIAALKPGADSTALQITDFSPGSPIEMIRVF